MFFIGLEIKKTELQQKATHDDDNNEFDREYEVQLEEEEEIEILSLVCEELQNSKRVRFKVEGFGKLPWLVDISTDLLIILEQLSDLLKFIKTSELDTGYLDFYEQGIERRLVFSMLDNELVKINCYGGKTDASWGQNVEEKPIQKTDLKSMICNPIQTFVFIVHEICPQLTSHQSFQQWCNDRYIVECLL